MATMRVQGNYQFGVLAAGISAADLTLSSAMFAGLNPALTASFYTPLALQNPATGAFEIIWVTGHTGTSTTATVVRGKEDTTAQSWPVNSLIGAPALLRDLKPVMSAANISAQVADFSIGAQVIDGDNSRVLWMTGSGAGWRESMVSSAEDYGAPAIGGISGAIPKFAAMILQGISFSAITSNASGDLTIPLIRAMPNGIFGAVLGNTNTGQVVTGYKFTGAPSVSSITARAFNGSSFAPSVPCSGLGFVIGW